jgi:hypothetical protein
MNGKVKLIVNISTNINKTNNHLSLKERLNSYSQEEFEDTKRYYQNLYIEVNNFIIIRKTNNSIFL